MKFIAPFLASLCAFFLPVQGILIAVGAAIALDTCTGIYKSVKTGKPLISRRFADVISKMLVYELVTLLLYAIDHFLISEFFKIWFSVDCFFTKLCSLVLIFTEMVSIKENIEQALGINILTLLCNALKRTKDLKDDVLNITKQ